MSNEELEKSFKFIEEALDEHNCLLRLTNERLRRDGKDEWDYQTIAEAGIALAHLRSQLIKP